MIIGAGIVILGLILDDFIATGVVDGIITAIGLGVTVFGAIGYLAEYFKISTNTGFFVFSTVVSASATVGTLMLYSVLKKKLPSASVDSDYNLSVGTIATVKWWLDDSGEITFVFDGKTHSKYAVKSDEALVINSGDTVRIVNLDGDNFVVEPVVVDSV